jgi:hypothetical protein
MDSRLRGNDKKSSGNPAVIPAQAGIHVNATEQSERTGVYFRMT